MSLRKKLAQFGFESNEDYAFALSCALESTQKHLRVIEPVGVVLRRKTAFAQALGLALEFNHRLYVDFSEPEPTPEAVLVKPEDDSDPGDGPQVKPLNRFERILVEACAFSESGKTLLVMDQLQQLSFAEQIRLYQFIQSAEFSIDQARAGEDLRANRRNLLVILISNVPLYHSLQKCAFRIETDPGATLFDFRPSDFALPVTAEGLFSALAALLQQLSGRPTQSEVQNLLMDLEARVRTVEHLRVSLFGRIENQPRIELYEAALLPALAKVLTELERLLGVDEVQISSEPQS